MCLDKVSVFLRLGGCWSWGGGVNPEHQSRQGAWKTGASSPGWAWGFGDPRAFDHDMKASGLSEAPAFLLPPCPPICPFCASICVASG